MFADLNKEKRVCESGRMEPKPLSERIEPKPLSEFDGDTKWCRSDTC